MPYTPLDEGSLLIEWIDTDALATGAWSNFNGRKLGATVAQDSGTSSKSATAFTAADSSTYPGIVLNGGSLAITGLGATLDPLSALHFFISAQDTATSASIVAEYTSNGYTTDGGFAIAVNDGAGDAESVEFTLRNVGSGTWQATINTVPMIDPGVLCARYDFAAASGQTVRELDGYALGGAAFASGCTAGTFANSTLYIGARAGGTAACAGLKVRDIVIASGSLDAAGRSRITRFMAARVGAVSA